MWIKKKINKRLTLPPFFSFFLLPAHFKGNHFHTPFRSPYTMTAPTLGQRLVYIPVEGNT